MIDPIGCTLNYASFFGGNDEDSVTGLTIDESGNIIGTGYTFSTNLYVNNALNDEKIGSEHDRDSFALKMKLSETNTLLIPVVLLVGIGIAVVDLIIFVKEKTR